jgi:hypothetical protein
MLEKYFSGIKAMAMFYRSLAKPVSGKTERMYS